MDLPRAKKPCREPQEEGTSPGRRLLRRDRLPEVSACLAGRGIRSVAVRDEVPLDKRNVSYYSFHIATQASPLAVLLPQGKGRVEQ